MASRGFPLVCVYVLSSSYEDTSPLLISRAARVRTVRNEEGESGGVKSIVTIGSQADPHVRYWNQDPGTQRAGRRGPERQLISCHRVPHRSLLGSIHFLLLVFLKVPLLLGMLGAVLWVNRPLRRSGGKPQENW